MGLIDSEKREVIELIRKELERTLPLREIATKQDIKILIDLIEKRFSTTDKRFEDINKRFENTNKRFEDMNRRFEAVDRRFEKLYRVSRLHFVILSIIISLCTLVVSVLIAIK